MRQAFRVTHATLVAAAFMASAACNDVPVQATTFSVKVTKQIQNSTPVKVDFLWLIDNTPSMCQEQAALAESLDQFLTNIESFVNLDYRIGVITQDMLTADFSGAFQATKTDQFPFACSETEIQACLRPGQADAVPTPKIVDQCETANCDCSNLGPEWTCETLDTGKKALNCNGTINSQCRRGCTSDAECETAFIGAEAGTACTADPSKCTYKCLSPSNEATQTGCVRRPKTSECPATGDLRNIVIEDAGGVCDSGDSCGDGLPCSDNSQCAPAPVPWLINKNAKQYFKCLGIVGTVQKTEATLEQSLNAVYFALADKTSGPDGDPNYEQARRFMREDAYLVVVIVSDEDDCSAADCGYEEKNGRRVFTCGDKLRKEDYGKCVCLEDSRHGGPLRPVAEVVNMVKSLKSDPGRILVAAIVGDSLAEDEGQRDQERSDYRASKCRQCSDPADNHPALENTYICRSPTGKADYGGRYREFVTSFGDNGIFTNICNDDGIGPALETIANRIIRVFNKYCLPRPVAGEETLVVRTIGPTGKCTNGDACCSKTSAACAAPETCSDNLACKLDEVLLDRSEVQDTNTWKLVYSGDCDNVSLGGDAPAKNTIVFNSVLAPDTDVKIDYEADYVGRPIK